MAQPLAGTSDPLLGQSLGEFELLELLGRGGMGAVYKAKQASLERLVAIKVLPQEYAADAAFLERFSREARAAAAISHPNIVQVIVVGHDKGYHFIAMEFVDGESLSAVLKREGRLPVYPLSLGERVGVRVAAGGRAVEEKHPHPPLSPGERDRVVPGALALMKQVASALAKAHAAGVVHRDIKPANILLTSDGLVKVADFGLAKRAGVDVSVTATGASLGTPLYMPPEVAEAKPCDARSDLYSLGATFYHLIAGRPPFEGASAAELILKHYRAEVPPLGEAAPDAPPALCSIIRRLLRKDPAERFQSAAELLDALDRIGVRQAPALQRRRPQPQERKAPAPPSPSTPTRTLPGVPHPSPAARRAGGAARGRKATVVAALGAAAAIFLIALVLILRPGPSSRSALRIPHSALPPSGPPTPTTQHPTPPSPKWTVYTKWPFDAAEAKRRQEETAKALGVGVEQDIDLGGGVKMTFVLIPAGEFLMGSPPTTSPEKLAAAYGPLARDYEVEFPQHRVRISRPFWIGKYEVTQEQWMAIFGANPSIFKDKPKNPVENVDWGEASGFTEGLSKGLGKSFRLPTEAEWEYACRAGTATEFYFGNDKAEVGAYCRVGGGSTEPVGLKRPNPWGIYDMAGNVWEWCEDCLGKYGGDAQADPRGAATSELRAFRGGSWDRYPKGLRSAYRALENGKQRRNEIGFRVVLAPELPPSAQAAAPAADDDARWGPWEELFDGKTLNGWRVSEGHYAAKGCQAKVEKGQILLDSAARMNAIVWTGRFPTDDYELGLETKALRGPWACCYIVFPVAASQATLHFQGVHAAWVSCVDGEEKNPISTRRGVSLPSRQWCKVLLRVCRGTVQVWVEGEKVIDFPTAGHTLSLRADIADAKLTPLALFTWDEPAALRSIRLRRLKPEGAEAPKAGAWKVYSEWPFDAAEAKRRQEETAKALGVPIEQDIALGGGVKMTFVLIPAGEFLMGSPPTTSPEKLVAAYGGKLEEYEGEFPQHRVNLSRPFWMTKTEVTQEQFMAITQTNPSANKDKPSYPVENVDWNQASSFAKMLGGRLGKTLRLPTEAEWEYACRAGTPTEFYWGDDTSNLADFACCGVKSTAPVGTKKPNTWGLCDTAANVWEWCEDWFDKYAAGAQSDPRGAPAGSARVLRGGSWGGAPWSVRTAYRYACLPGCRDGYIGFRVVLAPDLPAGAQAAPPPEAKTAAWKVYSEWPFDAAEAKRRQEETAKALGVPVEQDIDLGGGVKMAFVLIPAGEFLMGSPPTTSPEQLQKLYGGELEWYQREFPQHRGTLTRPFWSGGRPR